MKTTRLSKLIALASVCVFVLAVAAGCSASSGSSSATGSASASASSASSATATASASSSATQQSTAASSTASQSASASTNSGKLTAETAAAQGYQVFEGTVHVADAKGIIDLQAIDIDPAAAGGGGTYAVLVFDEPVQVTGMSADGSGERTESAKMLGIAEHTDYTSFVVEYGDLDLCQSLDGQHVTLAAKSQDIMFPSDVRIPIGEPSAKTVVILS